MKSTTQNACGVQKSTMAIENNTLDVACVLGNKTKQQQQNKTKLSVFFLWLEVREESNNAVCDEKEIHYSPHI